MEKNCQKYSLDENENLAKLCIKYGKREEDEKYSNRKINLSNPALTRRVSYQKLSGNFILTIKPAEDTECYSISKKVLQLVRLYESRKGSKEATCKKRKKFRERGGGRKVVTLEVNYDFFPI